MIVDITCGKRWVQREIGFWADLNLDLSPNTECDWVADFRNLPIQSGSCDYVLFDPPYAAETNITRIRATNYTRNFGRDEGAFQYHTRKVLVQVVQQGFQEIFRVLKANGICLFKWGTSHISLERILRGCPFKWWVLSERFSCSASKRVLEAGRAQKVYWLELWK